MLKAGSLVFWLIIEICSPCQNNFHAFPNVAVENESAPFPYPNDIEIGGVFQEISLAQNPRPGEGRHGGALAYRRTFGKNGGKARRYPGLAKARAGQAAAGMEHVLKTDAVKKRGFKGIVALPVARV